VLLHGLQERGAISDGDLNLLMVTDDLDAAMAHIEAHTVVPFGLKRHRPRRWLGERGLSVSAGVPGSSVPSSPRPQHPGSP